MISTRCPIYNPGKKKSKDKQNGRLQAYKTHHKAKEQHYNAVTELTYTEEIQETKVLQKKYHETKAKKTKKEKGDKTAKVRVVFIFPSPDLSSREYFFERFPCLFTLIISNVSRGSWPNYRYPGIASAQTSIFL